MALFEGLSEKLQNITSRMGKKQRVTESDVKEMMKEIRIALLEADVNYKVVKDLARNISERASGSEVMESLSPGQQVVKIVREELVEILGEASDKLYFNSSGFTVIMLYGLQGSGKTTTSAKLALYLKKQGKKPLLCSVDTHRPAAAKQLEVLAKSIDVPCFIKPEEKDARVIAREALAHAKHYFNNVLIVDTAGRQVVDDSMMIELEDIAEIVKPDEKLLVVDAMIGQEAVNVAETFENRIGLDGFIMSKLDGDARGGAALSIYQITKKPIKFITLGEKLNALEVFDPDRMVSRILGMGDVLSLIDRATEALDPDKTEKLVENLQNNKFTLDDLLLQFEEMKKMGPLKDIISMLPGANKFKIDESELDDKKMDRIAAIIKSMTVKERRNPNILNASRRKRIAQGSGTTVQDVNKLIRQYEEMSKMMKKFNLFGKKSKRKMPFKLPF